MIALKELRIQKGISQKEISEKLGYTQQAYSRYERGERELGYEALKTIAKFFDVSIDYLLGNSPFYYPDGVKSHHPSLSSEEDYLLLAFRALGAEYKKLAIETLQTWAGIPIKKVATKHE